jgi:NADH:ubiquinone oxidoreductase subunit 2 (subunit N)
MNLSIFNLLYFVFLTTIAVFFYYLRLIKIIFYDKSKQNFLRINFNNYFKQEYIFNNYRNWIIRCLILFLAFYIFFRNKRFIIILIEIISHWFLL